MSIPTGLNEHFTGTSKHRVPKRAFNSAAEALDFMALHGITGKTPYKCSFCGKYHIGSL